MHSEVETLHILGDFLFSKFEEGGGVSYIDQAIVLYRKALELCPPGHPQRASSLTQLQSYLWDRYNQLGAMTDIDEALVFAREALDLHPRGHPDRSAALGNLAVDLATLYKQLGKLANLDEAIVLAREALVLRPRGHQDRSISLNNLASYLSTRYNQLGLLADLNETISFGQEALKLRPQMHSDRPVSLDNLALYLSARYQKSGEMADLNKAIMLSREALALSPRTHPDRSVSLNNLAVYLFSRYNQLQATADLVEAIVSCRGALELRPRGHLDRSMSLSNLATYLSIWYRHVGVMDNLDEAISLSREALDLRPQGHPDRLMSLICLAANLATRHNQAGTMADLDEALVLSREALRICPGHPLQSTSLNNAALYLSTRYNRLRTETDLDEAIALAQDALHLCGSCHPDRSQSLNNLARYLHDRYAQSGRLEDKEILFRLFGELGHVSQTISLSDLHAAKAWANAAEDFHHPSTLPAYKTSLRLLIEHLATLPSSPQHLPILKNLASSLAVDAFSACLRNHDYHNAIELLEQGRGVFWNLIARLRSPLDNVVASGPVGKALADEFTRLASLIQDAISVPGIDQHDRMCRFNVDLKRVVTNIRELPGLSRFLLPPLFSDLRHAASDGPVIIVNASRYTCDALIVFISQDPVHVPLQVTKTRIRELSLELQSLTSLAKKMDVTRDLGGILREIWEEVVSPIVCSLQTTLPTQSRIWWCPTAEFCFLPLHAAGPYRRGKPNLSHLYISSYTPTLAALIHTRRRDPSDSTKKEKHFVAIGQAKAVGESELVAVADELATIGQRIEGLATFTRIEGTESTISRVSQELRKNEWVHFACHGIPNRKHPFESAFSLHDGRFTIEHIMRCKPENPQFAYLSACHTTVGDEESPDEVIHLASAMQFAGFRSVIGTMWAVDDGETNKITSVFYDNMIGESGCLDHARAAFALHTTMNKLINVPLDQRILYVHIGA